MKKLLLLTILLFPSLASAKLVDPRPSGPLTTRSQNPLYLQFLAMPMERAVTLNQDQFETELNVSFSNIFEYNPVGNTVLNFDMELWRTVLSLKYGVTENLDLKINLPFISQFGGFLDSFIQGYHNAFGFPNGGREVVPNNNVTFNLTQGGTTLFNHSQQKFGFADSVVRAKYHVPQHWHKLPVEIATAVFIKLPTGNTDDGLGSGHVDFGGSLFVEKNFKRFHLTTQVGYVLLGDHDDVNSILRAGFVQFGGSAEYQFIDGLSAIVQLHGNTAAFKNTSTDKLSDMLLDLTVGVAGTFPLRHKHIDEFYYQFGFSEDVTSRGPAIDFTLTFVTGIRY